MRKEINFEYILKRETSCKKITINILIIIINLLCILALLKFCFFFSFIFPIYIAALIFGAFFILIGYLTFILGIKPIYSFIKNIKLIKDSYSIDIKFVKITDIRSLSNGPDLGSSIYIEFDNYKNSYELTDIYDNVFGISNLKKGSLYYLVIINGKIIGALNANKFCITQM